MFAKPLVGIVMGSDSDLAVMQEARKVLDEFKIPSEGTVASAHRTPEKAHEYAKTAAARGIKVIIAGAGSAAHLAGVLAANTTLPVIGVPIDSSSLNGLDALLATVQMPGGIPVATMAIGKAGAKNAGILAAQIIGTSDPEVAQKLADYKVKMAEEVQQKAKAVESLFNLF
jgi:phosphoribosylamine--glycine ligase